MLEQDIVETIKRLGITEYEAKVYIALVKSDLSTADELSKNSGVPRSRIYGILKDLEARNWIIREGASIPGGKAAKYRARAPEETLKAYADEFSKKVQSATSTLRNLYDQKSSIEKFEFWALRGEDLYRTMYRMMKDAKFIVLVLQIDQGLKSYVQKTFEILQKNQSNLKNLVLLTDLDALVELFGIDSVKKILSNFNISHTGLRPFPLPFISVLNIDFERVLVVFPTVATDEGFNMMKDVVGAYLEIPGLSVRQVFADGFVKKLKGFKSGKEWLKELQDE